MRLWRAAGDVSFATVYGEWRSGSGIEIDRRSGERPLSKRGARLRRATSEADWAGGWRQPDQTESGQSSDPQAERRSAAETRASPVPYVRCSFSV
jgi:hypothetical protein